MTPTPGELGAALEVPRERRAERLRMLVGAAFADDWLTPAEIHEVHVLLAATVAEEQLRLDAEAFGQ